jgi:hypothetical protein
MKETTLNPFIHLNYSLLARTHYLFGNGFLSLWGVGVAKIYKNIRRSFFKGKQAVNSSYLIGVGVFIGKRMRCHSRSLHKTRRAD